MAEIPRDFDAFIANCKERIKGTAGETRGGAGDRLGCRTPSPLPLPFGRIEREGKCS